MASQFRLPLMVLAIGLVAAGFATIGAGKDPARAAPLYDRACQLGNSTACNNLGILFQRGYGVKRDKGRAKQLWKRACELGHAAACEYR